MAFKSHVISMEQIFCTINNSSLANGLCYRLMLIIIVIMVCASENF